MSGDPVLVAAAIDPRVAEEHPGLRVWTARVPGRAGRTPRELRDRLRYVADRYRGPEAVALRAKPVPWAYRVLYRHLGLDPDVTRTPLEALVVDRLLHGGFTTCGVPDDALAVATLETGVPVWAVDADRTGPLTLAPDAGGRLCLHDDHGTVAVLFAAPLPERAPTRDTRALLLIAVQAPGVEDIFVEESVWTAASAMPTIDASS
jgi:DNA/RNA-binding domain of Phe-tRNA-synthetase-like protein